MEPKPGSPIHDFLMPARFGTWSGRRHKRAWDRNLVHSFLSFNAGAWSLPPFLKRWTDFSAVYPRTTVRNRSPQSRNSWIALPEHPSHTSRFTRVQPLDGHATTLRPTSPAHQTFTAPHVVIRLLTPLGLAYEKAVERYASSYNRIIAAQPRMRQDTTALVQQIVAQGKSAYMLVNNRAEGCRR